MADPLVRAFLGRTRWAMLSGKLWPASIRDQMVRARLLVRGLLAAGEAIPGQTCLVIGGGPGGCTAALAAAEAGMKIVHAFGSNVPFELFEKCTQRVIDPTQYDWPSEHWTRTSVPYLHFTLQTAPARDLAHAWQSEYFVRVASLKASGKAIDVRNNVHARPHFDRATSRWSVDLYDANTGTPAGLEMANLLISCEGFGKEAIQLARWTGKSFWDDDDLERLVGGETVLIAGSGDGALQDFIRAVTGRSTCREVYEILVNADNRLRDAFEGVRLHLLSEEMQAQRAFVVHPGSLKGAGFLYEIHQHYAEAVERIARGYSRNDLSQFMSMVCRRRVTVHLAFNGAVFSMCYGLNRLLALWLRECILAAGGEDPFMVDTELKDVDPTGGSMKVDLLPPHADALAGYDYVALRGGIEDKGLRIPPLTRHLIPFVFPR